MLHRRRLAAYFAVVVAAASCSPSPAGRATLPASLVDVEPTTTVPPDTSTTEAPTTVETTTTTAQIGPGVAPPGGRTLSSGSRGDDVRAVEERLAALRFDPGPIDDRYDAKTLQAVMSFQKQVGLPRTGRADPATVERLFISGFGSPMVADGNPTRVEVDLSRQVLQLWKDGQLDRVVGVSTGHGRRYCDRTDKGKRVCGVATTPVGRFTFERHIRGLRRSDLGVLYDPVYFIGGYAVHGSPSVPATPASHGCVRIPMWLSRWFFDNVAIGTQMIIIKDGAPPVPVVGSPSAPPETAPPTTAAPSTTGAAPTTTRPPTTATTRASTTTSTTSRASTSTTRGVLGG